MNSHILLRNVIDLSKNKPNRQTKKNFHLSVIKFRIHNFYVSASFLNKTLTKINSRIVLKGSPYREDGKI